MSTTAFLAAYLGPAASCPPSEAARKRMRDVLITKPIPNPLETGSQASARNVPGIWPYAYAIHHGVVTAVEVEPRFREWVEFERDKRGLASGGLYATPITHVCKATHFTSCQHWNIGALGSYGPDRNLSRKQALELRTLISYDDVVTEPGWTGPSRAIGWSGDGLMLDWMASKDEMVLAAATALALRLSPDGEDNGVPYVWKNANAIKDPNHKYDRSPWMDGTNTRPLSALYVASGSAEIQTRLIHLLRCLAYAQKDDGSFWDDFGTNPDGTPGFNDKGQVMDPWIWSGLHAAKIALEDSWAPWMEKMLNGAKEHWGRLNRMRPTDSGFSDLATMGIAIACAPSWGWRA